MSTEIRVPQLGESVTEATVARWFKKPGSFVSIDTALVELETDKVSVEVPAPISGVLSQIQVAEGETVGVGAILGILEASAQEQGEAREAGVGEKEKEEGLSRVPSGDGVAALSQVSAQEISGSAVVTEMPPSPAAAKAMREQGLTVQDLSGSGRRGQILKEDVPAAGSFSFLKEAAAASAAPPASASTQIPEQDAGERRIPMSKLRQTIAQRLKAAQETAAMLTTFNEVDLTEVKALRSTYGADFEKKHGVKLGFMGFFTKAVCQALKDIPAVNSEIDGTTLVYKDYCHIGVAVGTEKGLVVPVIRDADRLSLAQIEQKISEFGKKAREGKLTIAEMQGGSFTISNGGVYGSLMSTPILNMPQSGILGMHKIQDRPMVVAGSIQIRPMMYLALSYDHRVIDGQEAVTFLVRVKELLEDPRRFVVGL